jgi:cholesterol oxidase
MANQEETFDYIVIGSGFGGSVSAMRLAEKGYKVLVIEKGKRWRNKDYPTSNWNIAKYLWVPLIKCFGIQKLTFFKEVFIISGVGVGGGSLVYANTHMMPKESFYTNRIWSHIKDWKQTLQPYYEQAKFMLGSSKYTREYEEDRVLKEVATEMGRGHTYGHVDYVGVYLGNPNEEKDPYFKGLGPLRKGCTECAACMVGCRHNAKNTLDKNYLWFAEELYGAQILAETLVTKIGNVNGEYLIHTQSSTSWFNKRKKVYRSKGLVMSGGVLGTMDLLLKMKYETGDLSELSDTLGHNILTNSEMLSGVVAADRKLNHGIAINSIFDPDDQTHIELCKFPDGSGAMQKLGVMAAGAGSAPVRTAKMIGNMVAHPINFLRTVFDTNVAKSSVVFLIMQELENSMKMVWKRGSMRMLNDSGQKVPSFIPIGQEVLYKYAKKVNGVPQNAFSEVAFSLASTAHILGGCPMGLTKQEGVVDESFRVHGYDNFYILDGSIMPCNLGVNPSLTITALSEYAMDHIPAKAGVTVKKIEQRVAEVA